MKFGRGAPESAGMKYRVMSLAGALALLSAACGRQGAPPGEAPARPVKLAPVVAQAPAKRFTASGRIQAAQRAELSFDRADVVQEIPVAQGQAVKAGDVIARLDTRNLENMEKARAARFEEARLQLERIQRLFERQAVAQVDLERARATCEAAEAEFLQVRKDLASSVLRAPFDGRIAALPADRFQLVQPKQTIAIMHDLSSYDIRTNLPETFILNVGRTTHAVAHARFDTAPDRAFPVRLKNFSTEASAETLTYAAAFTLPSPEGMVVLPGMSVALDLELEEPPDAGPGCWAPADALFSPDGRTSCVWRLDPDAMRVARCVVRTGELRDGHVRILEGLAPGDQVAVSGLHTLQDGDRIKPYGPAPVD